MSEEECEKALEIFDQVPDVSFIYHLPEEDYKPLPRKYKWRYLRTIPLIYLTNLMIEKLFIRHKYFVIPDYTHNTIYMKLTPAQVSSLSKYLKPVVIQKPKPALPTIVIELSSPDKQTNSQFDYGTLKSIFHTPDKRIQYYPNKQGGRAGSAPKAMGPEVSLSGVQASAESPSRESSSRFIEQRVQSIKSTRQTPRVPPTRAEREMTLKFLQTVAIHMLEIYSNLKALQKPKSANEGSEGVPRTPQRKITSVSGRSLKSSGGGRSARQASWDAGREDSRASFKGTDDGYEYRSLRRVMNVQRTIKRRVGYHSC